MAVSANETHNYANRTPRRYLEAEAVEAGEAFHRILATGTQELVEAVPVGEPMKLTHVRR